VALTRVLLIDPDEAVFRTVTAALLPDKYDVAHAREPGAALQMAVSSIPEIILLATDTPKLDLTLFVRTLRMWPKTVLIPIIFFAAKEAVLEKVAGFTLGADEFLPKPISGRELEVRVAVSLRLREKMETAFRPKGPVSEDFSSPALLTAFRGQLTQIGLPSLLSLIDMERKTGMLVLILEPEREKVRLTFSEGRLTRAKIDGRETPNNADLIYDILGRTQGKFEFRAVPVDTRDEINLPTARLLLEGARIMDETRRRVVE
jgi:CheY-like chemotaxis protein